VMVNVHVNAERRWTRALPEVEEHMRIVSSSSPDKAALS